MYSNTHVHMHAQAKSCPIFPLHTQCWSGDRCLFNYYQRRQLPTIIHTGTSLFLLTYSSANLRLIGEGDCDISLWQSISHQNNYMLGIRNTPAAALDRGTALKSGTDCEIIEYFLNQCVWLQKLKCAWHNKYLCQPVLKLPCKFTFLQISARRQRTDVSLAVCALLKCLHRLFLRCIYVCLIFRFRFEYEANISLVGQMRQVGQLDSWGAVG